MGLVGLGRRLGLGLGRGLVRPMGARLLRGLGPCLLRVRRDAYGGAYYTPYGYGYVPGNWTIVDTSVSPETTRVFLDGQFIGMVEDFDGPEYLYLKKGDYQLEFRLDGFETKTINVQARSGAQIKINEQLKKIPGAKQYGSYDNPEPSGGVQRFWSKEQNVAQPTSPMSGQSGQAWRGQPQSGPYDESGVSIEARPDSESAPSGSDAPQVGIERPTGKSRSHLVFRISPSDAAVYLDDRFAGSAEELSTLSRGLLVVPGQHTVTVSRPGLRTREETVLVGPGKSEVVDISLEGP